MMNKMFDSLLCAARAPLAKESIQLLSDMTFINIRDLLLFILKKESLTEKMASISYSHVLGFDKLILTEGEYGERVRLHVWRNDQSILHTQYVDIHDHYWDFSSLVLAGSLLSRKYIKSNTGSSQYHKIKLTPKRLGDYELKDAGTQTLELIDQSRIREGEVHSLERNQLHSIVSDGFVVTLVLQGPRLSKENIIYRRGNFVGKTENSNIKSMTAEVFREVIASLLITFEYQSSNKSIQSMATPGLY